MVNTRKKKEKTPESSLKDEESCSESSTDAHEKPDDSKDAHIESTAENSQPATEDEEKSDDNKPSSVGIRLVPLNQLLKPEIVNPPKGKTPRKARNVKRSSYIEVSSEESEQEQVLISSSSESDLSSEESVSKKQKRKGAKSTKLNNGNSSDQFKEPISPAKIAKGSKNLSVNVNKMPENVNKLMKSYRVESETNVLSWSESDDFENMIETSKIDRIVLDKEKDALKSADENTSGHKKRGHKAKIEKPLTKKAKKADLTSSDEAGSTRTRSTRNAAINRKKIVEEATSSSEEDSEDEEPLAKTK